MMVVGASCPRWQKKEHPVCLWSEGSLREAGLWWVRRGLPGRREGRGLGQSGYLGASVLLSRVLVACWCSSPLSSSLPMQKRAKEEGRGAALAQSPSSVFWPLPPWLILHTLQLEWSFKKLKCVTFLPKTLWWSSMHLKSSCVSQDYKASQVPPPSNTSPTLLSSSRRTGLPPHQSFLSSSNTPRLFPL